MPKTVYLRRLEVAAMLGISGETLNRMRKDGRFPRPDFPSPRITRWSRELVEAWIERNRQRVLREMA